MTTPPSQYCTPHLLLWSSSHPIEHVAGTRCPNFILVTGSSSGMESPCGMGDGEEVSAVRFNEDEEFSVL